MNHILMVLDSVFSEEVLRPLIREMEDDEDLFLTLVSDESHPGPELDIAFRRIEENGRILDQKTRIIPNSLYGPSMLPDFEELEYPVLFDLLQPDMVVVSGQSRDMMHAAVAATVNHIPVAHIGGGVSDFRTLDPNFGFGITKMSHLHFTSTEKYRQQVIRFGEHPDRVFTVGSLFLERVRTLQPVQRSLWYKTMGLNTDMPFVWVSFTPDPALGSRNRSLFETLLTALSETRFDPYQILLSLPKGPGLCRMIRETAESHILQRPGRFTVKDMEKPEDLAAAVRFASAAVGNDADALTLSPLFRTPMVNVGDRLQDMARAATVIDCPAAGRENLGPALDKALSPGFKAALDRMIFFDGRLSPSIRIKEIIKQFRTKDMAKKAHYPASLLPGRVS